MYGDCAYASQSALIHARAPGVKELNSKMVGKGSVTGELERLTMLSIAL